MIIDTFEKEEEPLASWCPAACVLSSLDAATRLVRLPVVVRATEKERKKKLEKPAGVKRGGGQGWGWYVCTEYCSLFYWVTLWRNLARNWGVTTRGGTSSICSSSPGVECHGRRKRIEKVVQIPKVAKQERHAAFNTY